MVRPIPLPWARKVGTSSRRWISLVLLGASMTIGCSLQYPKSFPPGVYTRRQLTSESDDRTFTPPPAIAAKISELVDDGFPAPWAFTATELAEPAKKQLLNGQRLYQKHCVHCHGISGEGAGPTAAYLIPPPRDFRRGVYKWKGTARAAKPTREDLLQTIRDGAIGTSMPPFGLLDDVELNALVDYVVYLSQRGELERQLLLLYSSEGPTLEQIASGEDPLDDDDTKEVLELLTEEAQTAKEAIADQWNDAADAVIEPAEGASVAKFDTPEFRQSVERGRELYLGSVAGCAKCHGPDGQADPKVTKLEPKDVVDDWGNSNPPRNLVLGLFRGGRRPIDLYRRVHEGIAGSSMPGQGQNPKLTKDQLWDIVNFLRALPVEPNLLSPSEKASKDVPADHALGDKPSAETTKTSG